MLKQGKQAYFVYLRSKVHFYILYWFSNAEHVLYKDSLGVSAGVLGEFAADDVATDLSLPYKERAQNIDTLDTLCASWG